MLKSIKYGWNGKLESSAVKLFWAKVETILVDCGRKLTPLILVSVASWRRFSPWKSTHAERYTCRTLTNHLYTTWITIYTCWQQKLIRKYMLNSKRNIYIQKLEMDYIIHCLTELRKICLKSSSWAFHSCSFLWIVFFYFNYIFTWWLWLLVPGFLIFTIVFNKITNEQLFFFHWWLLQWMYIFTQSNKRNRHRELHSFLFGVALRCWRVWETFNNLHAYQLVSILEWKQRCEIQYSVLPYS